MASSTVRPWDKVQEIRSGKFVFVGDGSVRLAGPSLGRIVQDVVSHARYGSITDVVLGAADAAGWKAIPARDGVYSPAWQVRRPRPTGSTAAPESHGSVAILIGLLLPAAPTLGPGEQQALTPLRAYLAPGARLHLLAGHKFTLKPPEPAAFNGYDTGFTGGVFVAT